MNKKVLIICTGNSCRSIIAEALINYYIDDVEAYSCGVAPSGKINIYAKKVLDSYGVWSDHYFSKDIDKIINIGFDLVVTVCSDAKESCPIFPKKTTTIHVEFEDPDGKEYDAFELTYKDIKEVLLPIVTSQLKKDI